MNGQVVMSYCTSCRQQGKQQLPQLRGRDKVITSCPMLSWIWSRKERTGPQTMRVQKSLSSAAKNTCCPKLFFTTYWLLVSHPMRTVREREHLKSCDGFRKLFLVQSVAKHYLPLIPLSDELEAGQPVISSIVELNIGIECIICPSVLIRCP